MSEQPGPSPEFALGYRAMMLDGLTREMQITRKVIAAIPQGKSSFKPDPNARTAWELAWHMANTDVQFLDGIAALEFTMGPASDKPTDIASLLSWYDGHTSRGLAKVAAMSAEQLMTPVDFAGGMFNFPAVFYLGFLNNHMIHHRGELATYLRPMGSKVPSIYGGSFDEPLQIPKPADGTAA